MLGGKLTIMFGMTTAVIQRPNIAVEFHRVLKWNNIPGSLWFQGSYLGAWDYGRIPAAIFHRICASNMCSNTDDSGDSLCPYRKKRTLHTIKTKQISRLPKFLWTDLRKKNYSFDKLLRIRLN